MWRVLSGVVVAASIWGAAVQLADAQNAAQQDPAVEILRSLKFQKGTIALGDNLATLQLTPEFRYLDPADTETFLHRIWGNPPEASRNKLGMLLPITSPFSNGAWGIVVTYADIGHVSDADAEKIDYDELLRGMQEAVREGSKERVAQGYPSLELVGWARQPYYDKVAKKLYWARRVRFGDTTDDTLNYEIRVLGRKGVLSLNVVAPLTQLADVDRVAPDLLAMVSFNQGNLYSEFDPGIDKAAAVGLAGLIAGGVLAKTGFFKGLLAMLLASKKLGFVVLIGFFASVWTAIKRFFRRKPADSMP